MMKTKSTKEKVKKNAKLGNDVKIYDIVSHRSFYVNAKDLLMFEKFEKNDSQRVVLKLAKRDKTPKNCGYFWVGPVAYKAIRSRFPKVGEIYGI